NVSITGLEASAGVHYMPKWTELSVTLAITAAGFGFFSLAVRYLPIFPLPEARPVPSAIGGVVPVPVLDNAGD
ncbi:MAG TPA: Ni/Fe-hydrogenase cytochrome b subunit, partial [Terriglobales bacterium]|nr:Ni/Fe-hydrogenase cytochrome b subunit [Terriglobales bacterium]